MIFNLEELNRWQNDGMFLKINYINFENGLKVVLVDLEKVIQRLPRKTWFSITKNWGGGPTPFLSMGKI